MDAEIDGCSMVPLEPDLLESVLRRRNRALQSLNPKERPIQDPHQFLATVRRAVQPQMPFRPFDTKPSWIASRFLGLVEPGNFAQMRMNSKFALASLLVAEVAGESNLLDAAMHAGLFESFQGGRLSAGQSRFRASLGQSPPPASASLNQ